MLLLYRLLLSLLTPLLGLLLLLRACQGKESWRRLPERLGWASRARPPGPLVWLHAASVGELASLRPLLQALQSGASRRANPPPQLLVTTVTRTAADLAPQLLPAGVMHQLVPVDHWLAFALFRRHWRPDFGLLAEAELWPELVHAMPRPLLINARVSQRSFRRHRRLPWFSRWLYARCQGCFAQSAEDGQRLERLGAPPALALGSTKWDAAPLALDPAWCRLLERLWSGRRVLLLASSHPGEELLALEAWPALRRQLAPQPLALLLAPRHPQRAAAVRQQAHQAGLVACLSGELVTRAAPGTVPEVVVVDQLGLMGSWLAAADLVVMGGSLRPGGRLVGGHNPLEPVRAGKPVVCGPDMANFSGLVQQLAAAGWLWQYPEAPALWEGVAHQLDQPPPALEPPAIQGPSAAIAALVLERLA
jgi:3-deoxy-D-manno-octulosonic-acid transferase